MKKILLILLVGCFLGRGVCWAQEGYVIAGKVQGMMPEKVHVVTADFGRTDTLASAIVRDGRFLLTGILAEDVRAVNLIFTGVDGKLFFLLENINYQVLVSMAGAVIEGEGTAARLYKKFENIGNAYITEKNKVEAEFNACAGKSNDVHIQALQLRLDNAYKASVRATEDLIKANFDSYISAYVVALAMATDDETTLRAKYDLLGATAKASVPGRAIAAVLEQYNKLAIGEVAPDFTLDKPDGNTVALYNLPAKWKLVTFWSSSDAVSRQEHPELVHLFLQFRPKGFEIVSVSLDCDHVAWKNAIGLDGMIWTNVSDLKGFDSEVARLYQVHNLPRNFLLDSENRIVAKDIHGIELRQKMVEVTKKKRKL